MDKEAKDNLTKVAKETAKYLLMQQRMAKYYYYNGDGVIGENMKKSNEPDWLFTPEQIKDKLNE